MSREKFAAHRNDIVNRYRNGESAASIGRRYGATTTTITAMLKREGLMKHFGRGEMLKRSDADTAISLYRDGFRPHAIIAALGCSKSWLYSVLGASGDELRGHISEPHTDEMKAAMAKGREEKGLCNESEAKFRDLMLSRGFESVPQVAMGFGSVDFVFGAHSVAVEVNLRGTFNKYRTDGWFSERIKKCANAGLHTYVFGGFSINDINADSINDVCAWLDFVGRSPASRRQYRVVWRGLDLLACGCSDDNDITIKSPLEHAIDRADRCRGS